MAEPPRPDGRGGSAVVRTFLIADVRGYTRFTQTRGDEAGAALAATFADVAKEVVDAAGGRVQELRGDEAMCVFASPRQAVRAAVELQRRFVEMTVADPGMPFGVGIGIDAGEAVRVKGGYRGGALNMAARLCSIARAGEVLASQEAAHLARQVDGVTYVDRGRVQLKGIDVPPAVVRVVAHPDPSADPAFLDAVRPREAEALRKRQRLRRRALAAGAAAAVVVVADVGVVVARVGQLKGLPAIGTNAVGVVDLGRSTLFERIPVGAGPAALAADGNAVWVANTIDASISVIDLSHDEVANTIPVDGAPRGIAIGAGAAWVSDVNDRAVLRVDERSKRVVDRVTVGNGPEAVASGAGWVWVANSIDGTVSVVDPRRDVVRRVVPVGAAPSSIAVGGAAWVANAGSATVSRIDVDTLETVATVAVGNDPSAVVLDAGSVWVANTVDGTVSRIDPATNTVLATVPVGGQPAALAADDGAIWVADAVGDRVSRLDVRRARVTRVVRLGNAPAAAVVAGGRLWLAAGGSGRSHRGGTLRVAAGADEIVSLDPAAGYSLLSWSIETNVYDGLMAFQRVGGPGGALVVPDLARALPTVSDGGRTYAFQLRPGIRFADGTALRAGDVLRSLRRTLLADNTPPYYDAIIGAAECRKHHRCSRLSRGVQTVDATGTVRLRLSAPDPELLSELALPFAAVVGASSPPADVGERGLAGTGPYRIDQHPPNGHLVLRRNPHFHEWSHVARPDGYPDVIDVRLVRTASGNTAVATAAGRYDYAAFSPPTSALAELLRHRPAQTHPFTQATMRYLFLNVKRPPFSDVRVRRALNYAIDRAAFVDALGGPLAATPTCQVLPPSTFGYRPHCPYTRHPNAAGAWSAPDLTTARELVAASGTAGTQVVLPFSRAQAGGPPQALVSALRTLKYRVRLQPFPGADGGQAYYDYIGTLRHHPQVGSVGWIADLPGPSQFTKVLLSCKAISRQPRKNINAGEYCNRAADARMRSALALQTTDPAAAGRVWAEVDRMLTDDGAWVPLASDVGWDVISPRAGNYQHHPLWGALMEQFWVR